MARKSVEANRAYYKKYYAGHKVEHKAAQDKYHENNPRVHVKDSTRGYRLQYLYKLTPEKYEERLQAQDSHCALCPAVQGDDKRRMAVDHNHACCEGQRSCGECLRGILCADCNRRLGFLEELMVDLSSPETGEVDLRNSLAEGSWTSRALQYLKRYRTKHALDNMAREAYAQGLYDAVPKKL